MTIFKFLDNRTRCKATIDVFTVAGIIEQEHRCTLPQNHPGVHKAPNGAIWATHDKLKSRIDNEGSSL
jgi:hypothetical protein